MHIAANDCANSEPIKCVIIQEQDLTVSVTVPPGQARDFTASAYSLGNLNPQGRLKLNFQVTNTTGGKEAVAVK
jgi:hypothetical protein